MDPCVVTFHLGLGIGYPKKGHIFFRQGIKKNEILYALEGSSCGGTGTPYPSLCLFVLPPLDLTQKEFQGQDVLFVYEQCNP